MSPNPSIDHQNLVYHEAQDRMALLPNYYSWIASHFRDHLGGTVLELGCGAGYVIRNYVDAVDCVIGADINPVLLEQFATGSSNDKLRAVKVDLRGDWNEIANIRADVVIALDVIEHFENDDDFVDKMTRQLRPGGKVILKVPAQARLYGEMDRASGHYRRYDEGALERLMDTHGFQTLSLRHMNPVGAWGYRLKRSRPTNYSKTFSPARLKIVNALIPVLALLDAVPGLRGLSLVGVFALR